METQWYAHSTMTDVEPVTVNSDQLDEAVGLSDGGSPFPMAEAVTREGDKD